MSAIYLLLLGSHALAVGVPVVLDPSASDWSVAWCSHTSTLCCRDVMHCTVSAILHCLYTCNGSTHHAIGLLYSLVSYLSGVLLRGTGIAWDLRHLLLAGVSTTSNPLLCFACESSPSYPSVLSTSTSLLSVLTMG